MAEAASAMRDVMSREEEPLFVIMESDPIYVKESTNCTSLLHIFNGAQGWLLPVRLSELIGARIQMEQRWRCHPRNRDQ